jgi:hypothetical protein
MYLYNILYMVHLSPLTLTVVLPAVSLKAYLMHTYKGTLAVKAILILCCTYVAAY